MRILILPSLLSLITSVASAQGLGYVEGGLAGVSGFFRHSADSLHAAVGAEVVANDHIGFGGELGFFDRLITGSANVTLHPAGLSRARFSPFVSGGYSRFGIGDGEFLAFNLGAGIHYWAADRVGFRMEFRDHLRPDDRGTVQYWSLRAGMAFR